MVFDNFVYVGVFCLYSLICYCAIGVVVSSNLVESVFYTIATTFFSTIVLFSLSAEFLAIIYIIIYVGAIAMLFLFVVMMLNVRIVELEESFMQYIPLSFVLVFIFFLELLYSFFLEYKYVYILDVDWVFAFNASMNISLLGSVLYTNFAIAFILSGLLLLLAMLGSIVLTSFHEKSVLRQDVFLQIERNYLNSIRLVN